jgi:hypothetical protein
MCKSDTKVATPPLAPAHSEDSDHSNSVLPPTLSTRQLQIDKLNERVEKIKAQYIAKHAAEGKPAADLPLWITYAQQDMTPIVAGSPVYQIRSAAVVYFYVALMTGLILYGMSQQSLLESALCLAVGFLAYDLYSGVLHVVFDHPGNIALPVLGQPCLEFQWHHMVPDDLVRKDFVDVCGDLNVAVAILMGVNLCLLDLSKSVALTAGGLKLAMAYYGQFSHRSAHSIGPRLTGVAKFLQDNGLAISVKDHRSHHQAPYDEDFCLIGICNPFLDALRRLVPIQHATLWLIFFVALSVFDVAASVYLIESVASWVQSS